MIQFCERIAEGISAYIDGEAPAGLDRESIEAHLRACTFCGALGRRLEKTRDGLSASHDAPPARVWDSIESTLRREGLIREPTSSNE